MRNIYLLFTICFGFSLQAQIVNIPDPNFKSYLLSNSFDTNTDGEIQISEAQSATFINVNYLNITNLTGIEYFINLVTLNCKYNQLTSLNLNGLNQLAYVDCQWNQIATLNLTGTSNLQYLNCYHNQIASLNFNDCPNLVTLDCISNVLTTLDLSGKTQLTTARCSYNQLDSFNINGATSLTQLALINNPLTSLQINNLPNLSVFDTNHTLLTALDVSHLTNLTSLQIAYSPIQTLDVSALTNLNTLVCNYNPNMVTIYMKNGRNQSSFFYLTGNTSLQYICGDEGELAFIQSRMADAGLFNCHTNSYCSFVPGGAHYAIQGNSTYDSNGDGCDGSDALFPNMKFTFSNGSVSGNLIAGNSGNYNYEVQAGTHTFSPVLENPSYFTVSPPSSSVVFPTTVSPFLQNFCVAPNGVHNDVEVVLLPITPARPGFNTTYKIIYKNKGTHPVSGSVVLQFDDAALDFVSASTSTSTSSIGVLSWNYTNLMPFESRQIQFIMNVNNPMEMPPINNGDQLDYTATINPTAGDEMPTDNTFAIKQIVVGSYDPNDKTCLEGTTITPTQVGNYVHYLIRFENTGTANAENIVVRDIIDAAKFDITSLRPLDSSHSMTTKITNTNKVEFLFENINLPFDDANNDGYVAFKIKTKSTLVLGNTFSNSASIYFDYNFPIITNTATTTVQTLFNPDFEFTDYLVLTPNPTKSVLNIQNKQDIQISSLAIYNVLGQVILVITQPSDSIDVSALDSGSYFIKATSDMGSAISKFIKE